MKNPHGVSGIFDTALSGQKAVLWAVGLALLVFLPLVVPSVTLMKLMCYALFAAGFNLLFGVVGLLSFGHAAFFGGGAYASAIAVTQLGATPELALLIGTLFAAALGSVFGFLAVRRQGVYFAMVTLAFAQMFYFACLQFPITGGEDGIQGVKRGTFAGFIDLSNDSNLYIIVSVLFVLGNIAIWRIVYSPFGSILRAIRDDEKRVTSLGIKVENYKLTVFILSAAICGLAGAMKALVFEFATLSDVSWHISGDAIVMTILGGSSSLLGPLVGASIYIALQTLVVSFHIPASVVTGVIFITCVLLLPRGVAGTLSKSLAKRIGSTDKATVQPPNTD